MIKITLLVFLLYPNNIVHAAWTAKEPYPENFSTEPLEPTGVTLQWIPGDFSQYQKIHFGASFDDVNNSQGFIIDKNLDFITLSDLKENVSYYWRVDEVNELHPDSPWKGDIWSFTINSDPNSRMSQGAAFYYTTSFSPFQIQWFGKFKIVNAGFFLPKYQADQLSEMGASLVFYEWATGFGLSDAANSDPCDSWQAYVYWQPDWILNHGNPNYAIGYESYYYDMANEDFRNYHANRILNLFNQTGYNGVFYDLTGFQAVPPSLQTVYNARHPGVDYDEQAGLFYQTIVSSGAYNFTNQAYNHAADTYPYVQYDLTESLMTYTYEPWGIRTPSVYLEGVGITTVRETGYGSISNTLYWCQTIQDRIDQYNPELKLSHLNYNYPFPEPTGEFVGDDPVYRLVVDRNAIHFAEACARVVGQVQYCESHYDYTAFFDMDNVYFKYTGEPLSSNYSTQNGCYYRPYEYGVAIVNPTKTTRTLNLSSALPQNVTALWDCFDEKLVSPDNIVLPASYYPASNTYEYSGRIYLYVFNELAGIKSDIDDNGVTNYYDLNSLTDAWLSTPLDANYNINCDISDPLDYIINLEDFAVFTEGF